MNCSVLKYSLFKYCCLVRQQFPTAPVFPRPPYALSLFMPLPHSNLNLAFFANLFQQPFCTLKYPPVTSFYCKVAFRSQLLFAFDTFVSQWRRKVRFLENRRHQIFYPPKSFHDIENPQKINLCQPNRCEKQPLIDQPTHGNKAWW